MTTTTRRLTVALGATAVLGAGLVAASTTTSSAHEVANTAPVVKTRNPMPLPQVTNLRYASHGTATDGYDRVVFDMTGSAPGYDVRYVSSVTSCGSGETYSVPGTKFLQVTLKPAQAHTDQGVNTYKGPGRTSAKSVSLPTLKGIRMICDFEGHVGFALGLDHKAGFHVATLTGPSRIYVDIAH
jgi:hypothetical protein